LGGAREEEGPVGIPAGPRGGPGAQSEQSEQSEFSGFSVGILGARRGLVGIPP
jgi:hypothetical protein